MRLFDYKEQSEKKYLVYKVNQEEKLDKLTIGMLGNNRIPGTVPVRFEKAADGFQAVYDVTNLETLQNYLNQVLCRDQILSIFEFAADAFIAAGEYMLEISSYVLDEASVYIDPETARLFMIVLPVECEEDTSDTFLRKMLFDIKYDQTENCSYIAALISSLGGGKPFDPEILKEQISSLQAETSGKTEISGRKMKTEIIQESEHIPEINSNHLDNDKESTREKNEESMAVISMEEEKDNNIVPEYILHRIGTGEDYIIKENIARIGRSPSVSEICISGNRKIGRLHAILYVREGNIYISDNGSKNNTFVDGEQIKQGEAPRILHSGSKIRLADEEFELRIQNK